MEGLWIIFDGEMLGYSGLLTDSESQVGPRAGSLDLVFMDFKSGVFSSLYCLS